MKVSDFVRQIARKIGMRIENGAGLPTSSGEQVLAQFTAELLQHIAERERAAAANPHGHRQKLDTWSWSSPLRSAKFEALSDEGDMKVIDCATQIAQRAGVGLGGGDLSISSGDQILEQFSASLLRYIAERERVAAANPHDHRQKLDTSTSSWICHLKDTRFEVASDGQRFKIWTTLRARESELQLQALVMLLRPVGLIPAREYLMRDGQSSRVNLVSADWWHPEQLSSSQENATRAAKRANALIEKAVAAYDQKIYNIWPGNFYL